MNTVKIMNQYLVSKAAKITKRSINSLYTAIKKGQIPAVKNGRYTCIEAENATKLIELVHSVFPNGGFTIRKKVASKPVTNTGERVKLLLQIAEKYTTEELELILKL